MTIPQFNNKQLFEQVFTHRSFLNEGGKSNPSNERLEFLGDSILSFVVSSYIYEVYPELNEGELTNLRSNLTNTTNLYNLATQLGLGTYLHLSRGEESGGGRENKTILADTYEALLGGLFIDQGLEAVKEFVQQTVLANVAEHLASGLKDAKSTLQEILQRDYKTSPLYKLLSEEGPDHAKRYTVGVYLNDKLLSEGTGSSKQEAEKKAAQVALADSSLLK